ncbi:hypothetical protein ACTFIY_010851 [Dictyostelium cf. discoideum]
MGEKLDAMETTLCLILKLYYFSSIHSEHKYLFHFSSFIFKSIISCFRIDEDRHGSLSKNLAHLVTTVFQAITQFNENPDLFFNDLYNVILFFLTVIQDLAFIYDYQEQQQHQQQQRIRQRQEEHTA